VWYVALSFVGVDGGLWGEYKCHQVKDADGGNRQELDYFTACEESMDT
jgi:hypothetical protein